jgi:hypothetical protein
VSKSTLTRAIRSGPHERGGKARPRIASASGPTATPRSSRACHPFVGSATLFVLGILFLQFV